MQIEISMDHRSRYKISWSPFNNFWKKKMVQSWPEFYADYGGTNSFWKFWDLDQNNPVLEFVKFSANISVYVHPIGPKFGLMDSFLTLNKMVELYKILE